MQDAATGNVRLTFPFVDCSRYDPPVASDWRFVVMLPFVVKTVAAEHEAHVRLILPFVSVAARVAAVIPVAVIPPFVTVRETLVALIPETWRSPFTVMIWTV